MRDVEIELSEMRAPAIWFRRQIGKSSLSKLGGLPTIPMDIEWPRQRETGTPLHFLAQIDLSHLPPTPLKGASEGPALPKSGLLFFFADMVEEMIWGDNGGPFATTRVIFAPHGETEREPPEDIPEVLHELGQLAGGYNTGMKVYPTAALEPHVVDTFGGPGIWAESGRYTDAMASSIEMAIGPIPVFEGPQAWNAIQAARPREYVLVTNYREREGRPGYSRRKLACPIHQMLGVGKNIQGTVEAALAAGDVLLLQIDSDYDLHRHFTFCDMGIAQFWIEPNDLAAARFDKAWGTTEGH